MQNTLEANPSYLTTKVADLLVEAGTAHGRYEEECLGGKRDEEWPRWYAAYMRRNGLPELLDTLPGETLVLGYLDDFLARADAMYRLDRPAENWPTYYARYLLRLASSE